MTRQWRGLASLLQDAIEHGSRAIERVHVETARRPFAVLEALPLVDRPARAVRAVHDLNVAVTYLSIRLISRVVGVAVGAILDVAARREREDGLSGRR